MKNRRDICGAKDAGWIQYPGLPGCIKTGCMASPVFRSPFCAEHKVRGIEGECTPDELVVEMLLGKKRQEMANTMRYVCKNGILSNVIGLHFSLWLSCPCVIVHQIHVGTLVRKI